MKKTIDVVEHAGAIMQALKTGVLLTTQAGDKVNTMTISWGMLGIEWGKPIFTTFVRQHRFSKTLLDRNPEFTINIPHGPYNKKILGVCGTTTGHDTDKIARLNLTLEAPQVISVPAIRELPLTLECRVVYAQQQDLLAITPEYRAACYPQDVDSTFHGANRDVHTAYYGEIVSAYIIE